MRFMPSKADNRQESRSGDPTTRVPRPAHYDVDTQAIFCAVTERRFGIRMLGETLSLGPKSICVYGRVSPPMGSQGRGSSASD